MRKLGMMSAAMLVWGLLPPPAHAQEMGRFRWQNGQVLQYQVVQTTKAVDISADGKTEVTSRVEQTKRWQVLQVDPAGVGTFQLTLTRLAMTQQMPNGETLTYDSDKPDQSTPQLRNQLGQHVGKPLATLRIDPTGKVVEVKSSVGPANRFEFEMPFLVALPGTALQPGQSWTRGYRILLDPPLGAGENYNAEQSYRIQRAANGWMIDFSTTLKDLPPSAADRLPLLQFQPKGQVVFDSRLGLIVSAKITSGGIVEGHQGEGSRYEFNSEYTERLIVN